MIFFVCAHPAFLSWRRPWPQRSSSRAFGWPVATKQSRGYCATLWRSHNRNKYYCVAFIDILVEKHVLLNLIQFSRNFTLFLVVKKIRDICRHVRLGEIRLDPP